jgi:hypothetical protein
VLISSALMCAALTWALQAWIPANWAMLGGFLAVLRLALFSYWTNSFFSAGPLCAMAGALVLGSLPRLKKTAKMRYGLLMAIGMAILELTRPYEGLLLCLPVTAALVHWVWKGKNRPGIAVLMRRAALPLAILAATSSWLGYYDLKVFGKVSTLPYTLDRTQYATAPYFVWQNERPTPYYRHARMGDFYQNHETGYFRAIHTLRGYLPATLSKLTFTAWFFTGFVLLAPLFMLPRVLIDRRMRILVVCLIVLIAGIMIEVFLQPHYLAPFLVVFYAIGMQAMRHLRVWKPENRPVGLAMVRLAVFSCVVLTGLRLFAQPLHLATSGTSAGNANMSWFGVEHYGAERAQVERQLKSLPGAQLAFVRYRPGHNPAAEWVYNAADIDNSKVVWAWEMNAQDDLELMHYYKNRVAWLVEPDEMPARVTPYSGAQATPGQ